MGACFSIAERFQVLPGKWLDKNSLPSDFFHDGFRLAEKGYIGCFDKML